MGHRGTEHATGGGAHRGAERGACGRLTEVVRGADSQGHRVDQQGHDCTHGSWSGRRLIYHGDGEVSGREGMACLPPSCGTKACFWGIVACFWGLVDEGGSSADSSG